LEGVVFRAEGEMSEFVVRWFLVCIFVEIGFEVFMEFDVIFDVYFV
jgi:hypothetical protein